MKLSLLQNPVPRRALNGTKLKLWPSNAVSPVPLARRWHGTNSRVSSNSSDNILTWNGNPPSVAKPLGEALLRQHGLCEKIVNRITHFAGHAALWRTDVCERRAPSGAEDSRS